MVITTDSRSLALGFTFPFVCAAIVASRFYMRRRRGMPLLADDWLCLPAFVCLLGICITIIYAIEEHVLLNGNVPDEKKVTAKQRTFAQVTGIVPIFWLTGASCVKFSVLLFYRRIFVGRGFDIISYALLAFNGLWTIYAFLSWLLFCGQHIHANFEGSWKPCPDYGRNLQVAVYLWDALTDISLIILPIPFVLKLQMATKHKFELVIAFTIGGFAFIASLLNAINQLVSLLNPHKKSSKNPTGESPDLSHYFYWQAVELGVGLISCCLPTLQPLYNIVLVHSWTALSATKRSVSSWRSHYKSAFSSSRLSRNRSFPLSSNPSKSGGGSSSRDNARALIFSGKEQGDVLASPVALSPMGSPELRAAPSESMERMC